MKKKESSDNGIWHFSDPFGWVGIGYHKRKRKSVNILLQGIWTIVLKTKKCIIIECKIKIMYPRTNQMWNLKMLALFKIKWQFVHSPSITHNDVHFAGGKRGITTGWNFKKYILKCGNWYFLSSLSLNL